VHISYFNNTMVYAWDLYQHYLKSAGLKHSLRGIFARWVMHYIRAWDAATAPRVDHYIANSRHMARRIAKLYGCNADVIYPPVAIEHCRFEADKDDYYVTAARLVPFKRIDLMIEAFNRMPDKRLIIIGDGPERKRLQGMARANISFAGFRSHSEVIDYLSRARAFVFSSAEPFGIAIVEALACGTPVMAFSRGAAPEIVRDRQTGILFSDQTPEALCSAVADFERKSDTLDSERMRRDAGCFSAERFRRQFADFIETKVLENELNGSPGDNIPIVVEKNSPENTRSGEFRKWLSSV
jgi:glycosyltransferase involved in cell wall biosynthesis